MGQRPDYLIKEKGPDGKNKIVGGAWSKDGQYGPFFSLSIGQDETKKTYIMAKSDQTKQPEQPKSSGLDDL